MELSILCHCLLRQRKEHQTVKLPIRPDRMDRHPWLQIEVTGSDLCREYSTGTGSLSVNIGMKISSGIT